MAAAALLSACSQGGSQATRKPAEADSATSHMDTILVIAVPDSALWGHMGEDTGMGVVQFITDQGDTLYLERSDENSGRDAVIRGDIRNYTDRFCVVTSADGESLVQAINVTQLQEMWQQE